MKYTFILLLISLISCGTNKQSMSDSSSILSNNPYYQNKFQSTTDEYIDAGIINFSEELLHTTDLVDENGIQDFSKQIAQLKFPKVKKDVFEHVFINEDKTSRLWFVAIRLKSAAFDNILYMIILKKNGKVVYLGRHMNS